jgi:site-specific DNA-methyltransferase (adenine-specific)
MINIKNIDCLKGLQEIESKTVDICITSPPYNLGKYHHTGNKIFNPYKDDYDEEEYQKNQIEILNELHRVIKDNGSMFYNHKNRIKNGFQISPYEWLLKTKWKIKQEIVWINRSQNFDKIRFYPFTERIYWLSKNKDTKFTNNINITDVNKWKAQGTNKKHKRTFPISMVSDILKCFPENLTVIDPYTGSGTTAIACINLGFNFIGFEIEKNYYKNTLKKITELQQQNKLF